MTSIFLKSVFSLFRVILSLGYLIFSIFVLFPSEGYAQIQVGDDINGEGINDRFGFYVSVSADGNRVAIGADQNDDNGSNSGHARIYEWNGNTWVQLGGDIDGETLEEKFGKAVALSTDGNRVAVGSNGSNGTGTVKIYDWNGSNWIQVGDDINGEAENDQLGISVFFSSDGNRIAIGAWGNDGNGADAGHVRVYDWNGNMWVKVGDDIDGEAAGDRSGISVSLSSDGNVVAVGAYRNNGMGSGILDAGHVRVYSWNDSTWVQVGDDIDGEAVDDQSGGSISLSADGSRIAIGALGNSGNGISAGNVRIFDWNGSAWIQIGGNIDGEAAFDGFGVSLSLSADGNRIAVGALRNDGIDSTIIDAGHVRVYDWDGNDWIQYGVNIDGKTAGNRAGRSVSLSSDGMRVAIGAYFNGGNGNPEGYVMMYELTPMGTAVNPALFSEYSFDYIFPNPASKDLNFTFFLKKPGSVVASLYNDLGQLTIEKKYQGIQGINEIMWDVSQFPSGIYHVALTHQGVVLTKKVVVVRK